MHFGGFLIFHTPQLKTFIDDRCELFGDAFLRDYARAEREAPAAVQLWQQEYGFGYALVQANTPLDRHLEQSRSWLPLRRTAAAVLYEHVQPAPRNLPVE